MRGPAAGVVLFAVWVTETRCSSDESPKILHQFAITVGHTLGGASGCPSISSARIGLLENEIKGFLKARSADADEQDAVLNLFNTSKIEGASIATNQNECEEIERRLSILKPASSPPSSLKTLTPVQNEVIGSEIRFGITGPFSGPYKDYGQQIWRGIEIAFRTTNDAGGIYGRKLRLIVGDDGFDTARAPEVVKKINEKDQVMGFIGNIGGPTVAAALPYMLEHHLLCVGSFTGSNVVRAIPPDRYVFNYRVSLAEETAALVYFLVKVRHIKPEQIAVFAASDDAEGTEGLELVQKAIRLLGGKDSVSTLDLRYVSYSLNMDELVSRLKTHKGQIKAVVLIGAHGAAAKFIEKTHDAYPGLTYTAISLVGGLALRDDLMLLGPKFTAGIIVAQAVPLPEGYSSIVLEYKRALATYFAGETADDLSLESYILARILIEALNRAGPDLDSEKLVNALETMSNFELGLGTPVGFSRSDHQALHKIWGTQINGSGKLEPIALQ